MLCFERRREVGAGRFSRVCRGSLELQCARPESRGFFNISTHLVWMLAGARIPARVVNEPYDSLNFASTILSFTDHQPPLPYRLVTLR